MCLLLIPTPKECQQDYYKYLNKLESVFGVLLEVLSQPTIPKHYTMGGLKDKDDPIVTNTYVVGVDDDVILDLIVDIAILFDTPSVSNNFSVYVFPKQLSPTIFK